MIHRKTAARADGRDVFLNCPYDTDYVPLFRAIVFAIHDCGFAARPALAQNNGAEWRLSKINRLIRSCSLGIHDISRTELDAATGLPRFNMPLELGLFLGAREFGDEEQRQKRCLVLDRERDRYLKFISDLRGQDPVNHDADPLLAIAVVRDWLDEQSGDSTILPDGSVMASRFTVFTSELPAICADLKLSLAALTYKNYVQLMRRWLAANPA